MLSPADLLFTDFSGQDASLEDVLLDGLENDVGPRLPGLRELLTEGKPEDQLRAAILLVGWGQPEGDAALERWAGQPDALPWLDAPASWDRFTGEDDAFAQLSKAVATSRWLPDGVARRRRLYQVLLTVYSKVFFGRALAEALASDTEAARELSQDLIAALQGGLSQLTKGSSSLRFQLVALTGPLARLDGAAAARLATGLILDADVRSLRELAFALGAGTGPELIAVLQKLATSSDPTVVEEANKALVRASR